MRKPTNTRRKHKHSDEDELLAQSRQTLRSMMFSLILLGLSIGFLTGFRIFLKHHTYNGPEVDISLTATDVDKDDSVYYVDEKFDEKYIIIKDVEEKSFFATDEPGTVTEASRELLNGELLKVKEKGSLNQKEYYCLEDGSYVEVSADHIQLVKEYLPLEGYIVITYISSEGVRVRSWIDYNADNIVKSVYVGDPMEIEAMITLESGESAFLTKEGTYVTTDSRYYRDCTNLQDLQNEAAEATTEIEANTTTE